MTSSTGRPSPAPMFLARLSAVLLLAGCGQMAVDGRVVNAKGEPLGGATVTILGTMCQTTTKDDGTFSLPCLPGEYDIVLGQVGYISNTLEAVEATARKRYEIGEHRLLAIPEETGLLVFKGGEYHSMKPGLLQRKFGGSGTNQYRWYCLDRQQTTEVNEFKPGTHRFFERDAVGWRPFKLDADGCAYRMSPRSKTQWGADYDEIAEYSQRQLTQGMKLVEITFEEGEYFIADWEKGFFTRTGAEKKGPNVRYSGFYVRVE